jgi:hypothetical protein
VTLEEMPPSLSRTLSLAGALNALACCASAFAPSVVTPTNQPMDRRAYQPVRAPKFYGVTNALAWNYTYKVGFLAAGGDLHSGPYTYADAVAFCDADDDCAGFTFNHGASNNDTQPTTPVNVYFKNVQDYSCCDPAWATYLKAGPPQVPDVNFTVAGLRVGLRPGAHTVEIMGIVDDPMPPFNFSFVPPLRNYGRSDRSLPGCHQLGDVTLRIQPLAATNASDFALFQTSWAGFIHTATPVAPPGPNVFAADDITPLLNATPVENRANPSGFPLSVRVVRSYERVVDAASGQEALLLRFNLTALADVRVGGFGISLPADNFFDQDLLHIAQTNSAADPHIGGEHAWAEWVRVTGNQSLYVLPGNAQTKMEAWRPLLEDCNFNGAMYEWTVLSGAWAAEWEVQRQAPGALFMAADLAALPDGKGGRVWPAPLSPWPSFKGNQTVWLPGLAEKRAWNAASVLEMRAGDTATYALRLAMAPEGAMRARDAVFTGAGEPVLHAVPGYTLGTDMTGAVLYVTPPRGATLTGAAVKAGQEGTLLAAVGGVVAGAAVVALTPLAPGPARLELTFSDGSRAAAHYRVLAPFATQIANFGAHMAGAGWLPVDYPDPFGRGGNVQTWDREDGAFALDDARAYIVGLSDDAGASMNLAHGMKVAWAPVQDEVARKDDYIQYTLYGIKPSTAKGPLRSLQLPDSYQVRMTMYYYCATPGSCADSGEGFPYPYVEQDKCDAPVGGPVWCMTENMANATYRGFNFPHQAASWYGMYRVARNYDLLTTRLAWGDYLYGAYMTAMGVGAAGVGFMDGTVFREILDALQAEGAGNATIQAWADALDKNMMARAVQWSTEPYPFGSEFSYDTTGQEEVFIWLQRYGYTEAANRTLNCILAYMRLLPNWAWHGGATSQGDLGNNGKWFINRGGERILQHYRAGLNNIPVIESYRANPDDFFLLEVGMGALTGQLANIDENGATSMGFHSSPFMNEYDPRSGDYGCGFFGITTEAGSFLVSHPTFGWLCFLCNLAPGSSPTSASFAVVDSYHVRSYLEPLGVQLTTEAGNLQSISIDLAAKKATVTFAPAMSSPASVRGHASAPFSNLRLNVTKSAPQRPGSAFALADADGNNVPVVRGAFQFPPAASGVTVATLSWT